MALTSTTDSPRSKPSTTRPTCSGATPTSRRQRSHRRNARERRKPYPRRITSAAKFALQHLAGRIPRNGVDQRDVLGHLELCELRAPVLDKLVGGHRRVLAEYDEGHWDFAPPL